MSWINPVKKLSWNLDLRWAMTALRITSTVSVFLTSPNCPLCKKDVVMDREPFVGMLDSERRLHGEKILDWQTFADRTLTFFLLYIFVCFLSYCKSLSFSYAIGN
ncbi:hypothetical protein TNIN_370241 [Trichonephila inaurata madagascariensis]|uniref:Uncharacterized protein n=1 Tax=Trichonephila inaurata madagascariensis TaxID=2747483 RepID=A0A8X6YKZ7_9ARAC|nr:hypothetical protein TNIN_370241 [Trichonephila inaurata madagascariensis]